MPKVTFTAESGDSTVLDIPVGSSVMKAAVLNGVDGIVGECGGNLMCATCHVYVDEEWIGRLSDKDEIEEEMLEGAASPVTPCSRLSCQITVTAELDGLLVRLPATQF